MTGAVVITLASTGLGQPSNGVEWNAPAGCPDAAEVTRLLQADLRERGLELPGSAGPLLTGRIERAGDAFRLDLSVNGRASRETRVIVSKDCEELAAAAALVATLALVEITEARPAPAPAPEPGTLVRPSEPSAAPIEVRPPSSRPDPTTTRPSSDSGALAAAPGLLIGVAWQSGVYPRGASGLFGGTFLTVGRFEAAIRGVYLFEQGSNVAPDAVAHWQYLGANARGCWDILRKPVRAGLCAVVAVGRLRGRTEGLRTPGQGAAVMTFVGAAPRILVPRIFGPVGVELEGGAMLLTTPASFNVGGIGPLHQPEGGPYALVDLRVDL